MSSPVSPTVLTVASSIDALSKMFPKYQFLRSLTSGIQDIESFWCYEKENQRHRKLSIYHCPHDWEGIIEQQVDLLKKIKSINHPNLVNIWDCWNIQNQLYVIQDYVEAPSVRELINEGRLGLHSLLKIGIQLSEAVAAIHDKHLSHGCITPNHIFISNEFLKLSAPTIEEFMSAHLPIQPHEAAYLSHLPDLNGNRRDLFSIGSVLFYFSTGYPPNAIDPNHWRDYGVSEHLEEIFVELLNQNKDSKTTAHTLVKALSQVRNKLFPEDQNKENFITKLFKLNLTRKVSEKHIEPIGFNTQPSIYTEELKPHEFVKGEVLGERFEILQLIEREDFDIVYRALDKSLHDREVWLHYFANGMGENWKQRFELIVSQLSKINHPHISQIIDARILTDGAYLVTQREDGEKLRFFTIRHSFTYAEIIDFSKQVLDALIMAEEYGFHVPTLSMDTICVYRHSNLGYFYRLSSVGHAHFLELVHGTEKGLKLALKPETVPPELYDGAPLGEVSTQFILGNIIFQLLAEYHPCSKMSLIKAYEHHQGKGFPCISSYRDDLPSYFIRWLKRLLEPQAEKRFASLNEAYEALNKCPKPKSS